MLFYSQFNLKKDFIRKTEMHRTTRENLKKIGPKKRHRKSAKTYNFNNIPNSPASRRAGSDREKTETRRGHGGSRERASA